MAAHTFDANVYPIDGDLIWCDRPRDRVRFHTYPLQGIALDIPVADFVRWCQTHGTKLRTKVPGSLYYPEFRDDAARELFRSTWVTEANLDPRSPADLDVLAREAESA